MPDQPLSPTETTPAGVTHEAIIAVLLEHRQDTIRRLDHGEQRMSAIERALDENTSLTREIRDAVTAGKWITRALRWAGGIAVAIVGLWSLYAAVKAGVPVVPPTPGVGP